MIASLRKGGYILQNKNRSAFYAGFSLFFCFCLLYAAGAVQDLFYRQPLAGMLFSVVLAFFVPSAALLSVLRKKGCAPVLRLGFPRFRMKKLWLAVSAGVAVSILASLLNLVYANTSGVTGFDLSVSIVTADSLRQSFGMTLLGVAVIPAVLEELFLRGVLQPIYEKLTGTWVAIVFTALLFAMLHGNLRNFLGPWLAGCLYGYLAYEFDSIWPSIAAHLTNNLLYLAILWLTDTYASFGIWDYFSFLAIIVQLLFLYLAFRAAEDLLEDDEIPHFEKCKLPLPQCIFAVAFNPGFLVFILAFAAKAIFQVI